MPAKAGIQQATLHLPALWIPAFAGMTTPFVFIRVCPWFQKSFVLWPLSPGRPGVLRAHCTQRFFLAALFLLEVRVFFAVVRLLVTERFAFGFSVS